MNLRVCVGMGGGSGAAHRQWGREELLASIVQTLHNMNSIGLVWGGGNRQTWGAETSQRVRYILTISVELSSSVVTVITVVTVILSYSEGRLIARLTS